MARENRSQTETAHSDEIIDADTRRIRRPFETPVKDYVTGREGNVLLAEAGKGAAWIEIDPEYVLDAGDQL